MTNPNICGQCDAKQRSCCTLRAENNDGLPAPVSGPEAERIFRLYPDTAKSELIETRGNTRQFVDQMILLFPDMADFIPLAFPLSAMHFELITRDDGCHFKNETGCVLPDHARPHFCRIYPFWMSKNAPFLFQDSNCLALSQNRTVAEALLSLGTTPEKIRQIHARICEDWGIYKVMPQEVRRAYL